MSEPILDTDGYLDMAEVVLDQFDGLSDSNLRLRLLCQENQHGARAIQGAINVGHYVLANSEDDERAEVAERIRELQYLLAQAGLVQRADGTWTSLGEIEWEQADEDISRCVEDFLASISSGQAG
jgi:hypothetical protein